MFKDITTTLKVIEYTSKPLWSHFLVCPIILGGLEVYSMTFRVVLMSLNTSNLNFRTVRNWLCIIIAQKCVSWLSLDRFWSFKRLWSHFLVCPTILGGLEVYSMTFRLVLMSLNTNNLNFITVQIWLCIIIVQKCVSWLSMDRFWSFKRLGSPFLVWPTILGGLESHWINLGWLK